MTWRENGVYWKRIKGNGDRIGEIRDRQEVYWIGMREIVERIGEILERLKWEELERKWKWKGMRGTGERKKVRMKLHVRDWIGNGRDWRGNDE